MLQNVEEVVAFLCKCLFECPKSSYSCSMKPFHITLACKAKDVDRESLLFIYDPIKGIMKIHSICVAKKNNLLQMLVKDLACFFEFCLDGHWTKCQT
jgi:hypothetical protein